MIALRNESRSGSKKKIAASADVSMTIVRSTRETAIVVADDLVSSTRIEYRKAIDAVQDFLQLGEYNLSAPLSFQALKALFEGFLNRSGHGFSGTG